MVLILVSPICHRRPRHLPQSPSSSHHPPITPPSPLPFKTHILTPTTQKATKKKKKGLTLPGSHPKQLTPLFPPPTPPPLPFHIPCDDCEDGGVQERAVTSRLDFKSQIIVLPELDPVSWGRGEERGGGEGEGEGRGGGQGGRDGVDEEGDG